MYDVRYLPDVHDIPTSSNIPYSCYADSADLDGAPAELRTRARMLELLENEDDDILWTCYGMVPDFIVSHLLP